MRKFLTVALFLLASPLMADRGWDLFNLNEADLPASCDPGRIYAIKDGNGATDCTVGGGSTVVACQCNNAGNGYAAIAGGGGGTPGGSPTEFQYNNAGSFGGITQATYDGTNMTFDVISGDTVEGTKQVQEVYNNSGATIFECSAVYISGFNVGADLPEVSVADNDGSGTMPALGLVQADISTASSGFVVVSGQLENLDTAVAEVWSAGAPVYVNNSGTSTSSDCQDTLSETKPTGSSELIQAIGRVVRVNAATGQIVVQGAGRSNDVPNAMTIGANDTINTDSVALDNTWASAQLESAVVLDTESPNAAGDISGDYSTGLTIDADSVALATDTAGSYVEQVADGTGIDGTANSEQATYTPTLDLTEVNNVTFGDNSLATVIHTVNPTGSTNPAWSYTDGNANLSIGNLQEGGVDVSTGSHIADQVGTVNNGDFCQGGAGSVLDCDVTQNAGTDITADLEEEGAINATAITGNAADDQVILGSGASAAGYATIPDCNSNNMLTYTQSTNTWGCDADDGAGGGAPVGVQYVVGASDATLTAEKILTDGTGIDTVLSGGDAGAATINLDYTSTQTGNPGLNAEECIFTTDGTGGGGILCEGTAADTNEGLIQWNPTTDKILTLPDATDTIVGRDTTDTLTNKTLTAAANSIEADDLICTDCIGDTEVSTNAGTSLAADLEEEVTVGSLADGVINEPDIDADNAANDGDILTYDSTGTNFAWITPNAGTDITADLEEEAHASEHDGVGTVDNGEAIDTASQEAGFLEDGGAVSLTCGGSNQGKMQVMDDGSLEFCDGATTSILRTLTEGGSFSSFDITDTDATPILTVDDTEQIQFIGAGTVTVTAAADASNHDITITGSAHDGTGTDDQNLTVTAGGADDSVIDIESGTDVTISGGTLTNVTEAASTITIEAVSTLSSYTDDLSHVEESTTVTDNADGMDITLSTFDIAVALDPSETANQAPDLADLVPYEDVTDGGIHHATFTQIQTLIDTGGAETNDLESVMTGALSGEIPIGTTAGGVAAYVSLQACAADEKLEYVDGTPDTMICEAIGNLVDADIGDISNLAADAVDAISEIDAAIKTDDADSKLVTMSAAAPASNECLEMDSTGTVVLAGNTCANLGPGGTPTQIVAGDSDMTVADAGAGTITATVDASAIGIWDVGGLAIGGADATDTLVLPSSNDAATPTLAFGAGEDTGFFESTADSLDVATDGTARARFNIAGFVGVVAGSPGFFNENGTATNPNLVPDWSDADTGIGGGTTDEVTLVAGGIEALTVAEGQYSTSANDITWFIPDVVTKPSTNPTGGVLIFSDADDLFIRDTAGVETNLTTGGTPTQIVAGDSDVTVTDAGAGDVTATVDGDIVLKLDGAASAVNYINITPGATGVEPVIEPVGDAGLAFDSDQGTLRYVWRTSGTDAFELTSSGILRGSAGSFRIGVSTTASATNPVFMPSKGDSNSGIGQGAADEVTLTAGGIEALTVAEGQYGTSANDITWFIPDLVTAPSTNPTGGVIIFSESDSLWIRDSSGTATDLGASGSGMSSFDITDTDASPILTVNESEQIQYIGAGTVTVTAAADASNHDVTITGSAHSTASDITMGGDISSTADTAQVDDVQSATANTEAADNNTTQVATTAFVQQEHDDSAGSCTNQVVTAVNASAAPTCSNVVSAMVTDDTITTGDLDDGADTPVEGEHFLVGGTTTQVQYAPPQPICKTLFDSGNLADTDDVSSIYRWGSPAIITEAWCEIDAGTNVQIDLVTSDGADNIATNCVCTTAGVSCSLTDTTMIDGEIIDLVIDSISGTVNRFTFCMEHRYDL